MRNFLQWLVEFFDAESSFIISIKNNSRVYFKFQIRLHIDDSSCLYFIKNKHPNKDLNKVYKSIAYKYQTVGGMLPLYDLFYEE